MLARIIATAALGGALAIGGSTAAWAATPAPVANSTTSAKFNCANAAKALQRIGVAESKAQSLVTKAGRTQIADRIARRIAVLEKREARGTKLTQRIETACPGSGSAGATS